MTEPVHPAEEQRSARITRVVTRGGDAGMTSLVGGRRVHKDDARIEAYGTSDELQTAIGGARDAIMALTPQLSGHAAALLLLLEQHLVYIQNLLFTYNAELATLPADRWPGMPVIGEADLEYLERLVAACNRPLPPLKDFVLPGDHPAITALHVCRVIARRAERKVEHLARQEAETLGAMCRPFINRLSDVFFVLARRLSHELREAGLIGQETIWQRGIDAPPMPE